MKKKRRIRNYELEKEHELVYFILPIIIGMILVFLGVFMVLVSPFL